MTVGDILCIKTTGEKVFVLELLGEDVAVRRAFVGESGVYKHARETFSQAELETVKEHCDRQVSEMIIKGNAQKTLMLAEKKFNEEMELEMAEGTQQEAKEGVVQFPAAKKVVN